MKVLSIFGCCLWLSLVSLSAQQQIDSLRSVAENETLEASSRLKAMNELAHYYIHHQPDSTRYFSEQQLSLARSESDQGEEAKALFGLSTYYLRTSQYPEAIKVLRENMILSRAIKDSFMIGDVSRLLAGVNLSLGEVDSARYYFQLALTIFEQKGSPAGMAAALGGLGMIAKERSEFDLALSHYERAISLFEETGYNIGIAMMCRNIAFIHVTRDDYETSLEYSLRGYAILESLGDKTEMAGSMSTIALTHLYMDQYDEALAYQQKSLELYEAEKNQAGLGTSYGNLGLIYGTFGNSVLALENYEKSLRIKEQIGDVIGQANTLTNIGGIFSEQKEFDQALTYFERALSTYEETGNKLRIGDVLNSIANIYQQQGKDSLALAFAIRSLEIGREIQINNSQVQALITIGDIYASQGKSQEANEALEEGLAIAEETEDQSQICAALNGLAQQAYSQKNWRQVRVYAQRSLEIAEDLESIHLIRNASRYLWQSQEALGQKAAAFDSYRLFVTMRDSLLSEENQRATIRYEFREKALADSLQSAAALTLQVEENQRRKSVSNLLIGGLGITLILGMLLWNRFRITRRQKGIIETEKNKLDQAYYDLDVEKQKLSLANEKLQELDDFKSRFFTNISHEFRTPLTVISGMMDQITKEPDRWLEKGSEMIRRNVHNLLNLINQILDLRKLESGSLNLSLIQDDVVSFLRYGTESFESLAVSKSVTLKFESSLDNLMMDFDPDKLLQIQTNLISNALKFTPKNGVVTVQVESLDGKTLQLTFSDSGIGIPSEKLPFIFDRFYQVDSGETREGEGTGIGLSLTRELVRLMKGEINAESSHGEGSVFTVLLPITQSAPFGSAASLKSPEPVVSAAPLQEVRPVSTTTELPSLLIIEDNPDIVSYLYASLEDHYELYAASDGQAGIDFALEQVPDLIITDVMMPRKNGYEVCETLKLDPRTSHIPIVMLTAKVDQDSRLEGYKRGADAYLPKPF